jgi:hypothetical protein
LETELTGVEISHPFVGMVPGPVLRLSNGSKVLTDRENVRAALIDDRRTHELVRYGSAPDELFEIVAIDEIPFGLAVYGGRGRSKLLTYDLAGQFRAMFELQESYLDMASLGHGFVGVQTFPHSLAAASGPSGREFSADELSKLLYAYAQYDDSSTPVFAGYSRLEQKLSLPPDGNAWMSGSNCRLATHGDVIYIVNRSQNYLARVSNDGNVREMLVIDDPEYEEAQVDGGQLRGGTRVNNDICVDEQGVVFVAKSDGYPGGRGRVDVFRDMELVAILKIDAYPDYISARNGTLLVSDANVQTGFREYDYAPILAQLDERHASAPERSDVRTSATNQSASDDEAPTGELGESPMVVNGVAVLQHVSRLTMPEEKLIYQFQIGDGFALAVPLEGANAISVGSPEHVVTVELGESVGWPSGQLSGDGHWVYYLDEATSSEELAVKRLNGHGPIRPETVLTVPREKAFTMVAFRDGRLFTIGVQPPPRTTHFTLNAFDIDEQRLIETRPFGAAGGLSVTQCQWEAIEDGFVAVDSMHEFRVVLLDKDGEIVKEHTLPDPEVIRGGNSLHVFDDRIVFAWASSGSHGSWFPPSVYVFDHDLNLIARHFLSYSDVDSSLRDILSTGKPLSGRSTNLWVQAQRDSGFGYGFQPVAMEGFGTELRVLDSRGHLWNLELP